MKLIGSKMENDFREELLRSNGALQDPKSKLRQVLELNGYETKNAYVLHWTPEQLEDLYTVLINGSYLVHVEIDKFDKKKIPIVEKSEIKAYLHGLSKMHQVRLVVAQELVDAKT